uniref:G-protein coupled receptors family 1 profile domain-containing protein n=1 Tax=Mola mola TaxID=94237 RepID=A0A3Q3XN42_MOLML
MSISNPSHVSGNDTNPEIDSVVSNDFSTALGSLILGLVLLLGVPGNFFIVWSILARIRRRSVTTLLILNLACADGFLMALTIFFIVYLTKQTWMFGTVMCKGVFYLCNANMYASIFLITLMSVHRMVVVVLPKRVGSAILLTAAYMCRKTPAVIAVSVPVLHLFCAQVRFQYAFETVAGFILPYTIIIISYVLILRRLRQTNFRRKVRSEKLILAIVVMFGIFWLPYHVVNMIQVAAEWYPEGSPTKEILVHISKSSRAVTSAFAFTSSCANPVLYAFAGKSYIKQNGFAFIAQLFEGTSPDQPGNKKSQQTKDIRKTKQVIKCRIKESYMNFLPSSVLTFFQ